MGIGTTTPTSQLDVTSIPSGGSVAISGKGKNIGVSGEAFEMTLAAVTQQGIDRGDKEAIGVFGKGTYTTTSGNGNVFGVAGSAVTANNPLNNIGVFGEAKNALGYNTGVIGWNDSTTGIYNTGTSGYVALNPTGVWSRAIAGYAPVAPNHYAGYFEGKVAIVDGTQANNYVLTSDANGLATWTDPSTLLSGSTSTDWHLSGNASTNPLTDFVGTTDAQPLNFKTNNIDRAIITATGEMGIGTTTPAQKVHIKDGALLLSGAVAGFGGPQLLFSDNDTTHPNGRWGIEYITATSSRPSMGGLNFWTPFNPIGPSGTAGNYSLFLKDDGKISMGATDDSGDANFCASSLPNGYRLYVNGGILTTKVKVANYCSAAWADYVFANDYKLKPLSEVEAFIKENKHLPNVPSATKLEKDGLDIADMQSIQMAKIEELTLYMIEMKKEIEVLKKQNGVLTSQISKK